jgi:hypothetical protein
MRQLPYSSALFPIHYSLIFFSFHPIYVFWVVENVIKIETNNIWSQVSCLSKILYYPRIPLRSLVAVSCSTERNATWRGFNQSASDFNTNLIRYRPSHFNIVGTITQWSNSCPTARNHLRSSHELSVYSLLHINTTFHNTELTSLHWAVLNWTGNCLTHSITALNITLKTLLTCTQLSCAAWVHCTEDSRADSVFFFCRYIVRSENCRIFTRDLVSRRPPSCFLNPPYRTRGARRPVDASPQRWILPAVIFARINMLAIF